MAAILPRLPDHTHTLFISTVGFAIVHHLAGPEFARFLLGKKAWDALGVRERLGWCVVIRAILSSVYVLTTSACPCGLQAVARDLARPCFADPPAHCELLAYPGARGGPRVRMGPARWHAVRCYERVSGAAEERAETVHSLPHPPDRYFLWDSVVCLVHYEGFGFVFHGARISLSISVMATNFY
jgi:hypothetical protein